MLAVSEVDSSRYNVWAVHVLAVSEVDSSRYNVWAVHVLAVSEVDSSRYNVWAVHVLAVSEVDSSRYNVWVVHVLYMYMYIYRYIYRPFQLSTGLNSFHTTFLPPPSLHTGTCTVISTEALLQTIHRTNRQQSH